MMEVINRFQAIGTIEVYKALPVGERILYDQYTIAKLEDEAKLAGMENVKKALQSMVKG